MSGVYLAGLLLGIAGLLVIDARWRLFVFARPLAAIALVVIAVLGFLAWDAAGIALGIFFEGGRQWLVGVDVAPEIPVEEPVFLALLSLAAMVSYTGARRILEHRRSAQAGG